MPDATTVAACPHGVAESAIEPYWKWADTRGVEVMVCVCCDAPGPVEFLRVVVLLGEDEIPIE